MSFPPAEFPPAEFPPAAIAREPENEVIANPSGQGATRLLLDGLATGGAMSVVRAVLQVGASGPGPHGHETFSELLYVAAGILDVLSGEDIVTLEQGDLVVVPPTTPHAFAAHPGSPADVLIVSAPGIERFDYFRQLGQQPGFPPPADFQARFDNYYLSSETWAARPKA
jgi:mannose-6-phosphate isomerase-like protein (cupin superfamily)